ncbi:MAG: hypothetical protein U0271_26730 [Polyangiaceae bacterium]
MATSPKTKKKKRASDGDRDGGGALRRIDDRRVEYRFTPRNNVAAGAAVFLSALGSLLFGAGVFAQFIRAVGPHKWGIPLLVAGPVLFLIGYAIGRRAIPVVRVGDAGLATEGGDGIERLAWCDVDGVRIAEGVLTFSGNGRVVALSIAAHPDAAAHALREARGRIPNRVAAIDDKLEAPIPDASMRVVLEPMQIAGLSCKASGRPISFEKDARLCGYCGQVYHRETAPRRCLSCDARL